jgi:hypothetical protein
MRFLPSPLFFVVLLSLVGCSKSPRDRLQGRWVGEAISNVQPDQQGRADGWVKGTRVEFAANKVTVGIPAESARSGTYTVARAEGNDMELVFKRPEGVEDRTRMRFTEDGRLAWTLKGGAEIMLRRE